MKKALCTMLAALMLLPAVPVFAEEKISVFVNGKQVEFDQEPIIEDNRVLVPLRAIFEELNCNVNYTESTKTVSARRGERALSLKIDDKKMNVSDEASYRSVELDVPAKIVNGRTMVPVRAVSEGLDASVKWDESTKTVYIEGKKGQHNISSEKIDAVLKGDDGTGIVDFYYSYPVIENSTNDPFIKAINETYKKEADAFYEEIKNDYLKEAQMLYEGFKTQEEAGEVKNVKLPLMEFSLDYVVTIDRNDLLSITQFYFYDSAGAHPSTMKRSRTFDLKNKKQLKLGDILNGTEREIAAAAFRAFDEYIKKEFAEYPDYGETVKAEMKNEFKNISYYVDDDGLVIYYQVYQVGPYAMGYPKARMDYNTHESYFKIDLSGSCVSNMELKLKGNPTTGYEWVVSQKSDNIAIDVEYIEASGTAAILGEPGTYKFNIKGLEKGNASFTLQYKRSWEDEVIESVKYDLYVNDDNTLTIINKTEKK